MAYPMDRRQPGGATAPVRGAAGFQPEAWRAWARTSGLGLLLCACAWGTACRKALPVPPGPAFLRVETGAHTAPIQGIDVDAAGRYLVTGSLDKTVRVWEVESGKALGVLRVPIGADNEGMIYAVAISPDGETVAAGGWARYGKEDCESIYLFDRSTGRVRRRITGLASTVHHLAFSRDGLLLAATLGGLGVRVFLAADGRELWRDTAYANSSLGADFDAAGRLATTSYDGQVRLYGPDLKLVAKVKVPGGGLPLGIAISPDGRRIAVGYMDSQRVDVLSGDDLRLLYSADTQKRGGVSTAVAWSPDGVFLFGGGRGSIRRWEQAGSGAWKDLDIPQLSAAVTGLRPLAGGRAAFSTEASDWGVLARDPPLHAVAPYPYLSGEVFRVAPDGKVVDFGYEALGFHEVLFNLETRRLSLDPPADLGLEKARTKAEGLAITGLDEVAHLALNGKSLPLKANELSRSVAIAPDAQSFLVGTDWYLRSFNRAGESRWVRPSPGSVLAVLVTPDSRLAVAALSDGTVRWYRYSDGQELLALFASLEGGDLVLHSHPDLPFFAKRLWVLWTPSGYYDTSKGGESLFGWHINQGLDHEGAFFPAAQFRNRYHHPEVINRILDTLDEAEAVRQAGITPPSVQP